MILNQSHFKTQAILRALRLAQVSRTSIQIRLLSSKRQQVLTCDVALSWASYHADLETFKGMAEYGQKMAQYNALLEAFWSQVSPSRCMQWIAIMGQVCLQVCLPDWILSSFEGKQAARSQHTQISDRGLKNGWRHIWRNLIMNHQTRVGGQFFPMTPIW